MGDEMSTEETVTITMPRAYLEALLLDLEARNLPDLNTALDTDAAILYLRQAWQDAKDTAADQADAGQGRRPREAAAPKYKTERHDFARQEREATHGTQYRMKCSCGKWSQWTYLTRPVMTAQDKHADEVARDY